MAALLNFWSSPSKQDKESVNGTGPTPRGTKRKAKRDPYDDMDDDDDVIPARKTPTSQRTARSRLSSASATPASTSKPRTSLTAKRRPGRPSLKSQQGDTPDTPASSRAATGPSPARAKATDAAAASSDSLVPEAPMGGLELLGNNAANAPASSAPKPEPETVQEPPVQNTGRGRGRGKGKEKLTETVSAPDKQVPVPEEDTREEHEIERLLKHRMASDKSGAVELLVQWEGEGEQDATWEAEEEIQENAADTLYEYWKAQGGRISALFHKPKNAPPETYHVFKVLRHERKNRGGGFQFEVQWVGHPATHGETTMEAETKLKNIAPELLQEYWESVGGRAKYLAARGRAAKKSRVE
ncbi:hypothetical protein FHL15_010109 [Xylaria flabelliformis]|uniref:Chromo domain-containing protein n=1 Tax=Xylaria flabelliformis TaxID=2512241 RepID=A0A553HM43_9PEZI|nr:hypothetical protein FHL15_010109 [Xylaria flabelliformis]